MEDDDETGKGKRHGKGIPAHENRRKKPKVDPTESSRADDTDASDRKGKKHSKKQSKKQKKVQYSTSRWPSTSPESEIDQLYVPKCLAAGNFPLNVKEHEVMKFFEGKAQKVEFARIRNKRNQVVAIHSLITFDSVEGATEGLKYNGQMLRESSIYVTRQGNSRKILCVSGFDGKAEEEMMKKQLWTEFASRGVEVLKIFLPRNIKTGLCLGFCYILLETKDIKPKKLYQPITIDGVKIAVRDSTLRTSYLPELLGKKNVTETEKSLLKKVLLPIPPGLHDASGETFLWEATRPDIIPETVKQDSNDCWAIALTRHHKALLQLQNIVGPFLTRDQLKRGVGPAHVVSGQGIDRLKNAVPFMKSIGCDMQIHNRPRGDDVREFEAFEEFIELLLKQGPLMVNVECTPGFSDFNGEGIYLPSDSDIYLRTFEKFPTHCILLTGYGVKDGKQYWRLQDSNGQDWGEGGFIMMERHKCLIRNVVELKIA